MEIEIETGKRCEIIDITDKVKDFVEKQKVKDGICFIFVPHATAAIVINENYDPLVREDICDALSKLVPRGKWRHDRIDGNADAHIKSSIVGCSTQIPIENGKLCLGIWQGIGLLELDGPKKRKIILKIIKS